MALILTDENYEELVLNSDKPELVDFWAEWCGPCKALTPTIEDIAAEYEGRAVVGKVNVDESPKITRKYGIRNIPTLLYIKNGEVVDKQVGTASKSNLTAKLDALI
ncbi:MAG: thioredoxin [Bacteroidales bacterium]|jgi:thioredoxin 1|nr:thioredoxin [Bacteroidales bacterium]